MISCDQISFMISKNWDSVVSVVQSLCTKSVMWTMEQTSHSDLVPFVTVSPQSWTKNWKNFPTSYDRIAGMLLCSSGWRTERHKSLCTRVTVRNVRTVDGVCWITFCSGSIDTPTCAMWEMGWLPKIPDPPLLISSSFFNCEILNMAEGLEFEM